MKKTILLFLFQLSLILSFAQHNIEAISNQHFEIPEIKKGDNIVRHHGYTLLYNEQHEEASWVAYLLTAAETQRRFARTNKFISDPNVSTGSADDEDYKGSGFDRGHLAPAADMGWSEITMAESFYYSNMSPQLPAFNRGIWKKLEELVRDWAVENDSLYIVTGPVLYNGLTTIGHNRVSVPDYFYKVILDYHQPNLKGIGFVLSNAASNQPLMHFAVTIDSVEHLTGINFFPLVPDNQEKVIEKNCCIECWTWDSKSNNINKTERIQSAVSVQCKGITKAGNRCRNQTKNPSGYCFHHEDQSKSN